MIADAITMPEWISPHCMKTVRRRAAGCTVIVPPYAGEFGWELMNWQARLRAIVRTCAARDVIVFCEAGKEALYRDIDCDLQPLARVELPGEASEDHRVDETGRRIATDRLRACLWQSIHDSVTPFLRSDHSRAGDLLVLAPGFRGDMWPTRAPHQRFIRLRNRTSGETTSDIVLVRRLRRSAASRNRSDAWWDALAKELNSAGVRVAFCPTTLNAAVEALSRTRLAAGGSTGGLHLASLCECPQFVWGDDEDCRWTAWDMSNRQRYETYWNPFASPVMYAALGWQPAVEAAAQGILGALHAIGRGACRRRASVRWSMKRQLAGLSVSGSTPLLPWRVRRWLRTVAI